MAACTNLGGGDCPSTTVGAQVILADPSPAQDCAKRCAGAGDTVIGCRTIVVSPGAAVNVHECNPPSAVAGARCFHPRLVCQTSSGHIVCGDDQLFHPTLASDADAAPPWNGDADGPDAVADPTTYVQCDLNLPCE